VSRDQLRGSDIARDSERMDSAFIDRFWAKVRKGDGCWEWTGSVKPRGYGQVRYARRTVYAHRVAWELAHGPIPDDMFVCHSCDNRRCVRHLFLGTAQENTTDMLRKGRSRPPKGEDCGTAKLTRDAVMAMRSARDNGATFVEIARQYGVHPVTAMRAVKGEQWRHV
jgi:hypothetical protein